MNERKEFQCLNCEFANIIVNNNISYEIGNATTQHRPQLGILPQIVKELLDRRIHFKRLMKQFGGDSTEANYYEERAETIKKILVSLYGTTGSYWNKYRTIKFTQKSNIYQ